MDQQLLARLQAGETLLAEDMDLVAADTFASRTVGLQWDSLALERIVAHLDIDERHLQPYGLVHGGVWSAVVESTASFGAALNAAPTSRQVVGVSNSTDFLRGVRDGRVEVVASPLHVGRFQQLWQVEITRDTDGKLVARGQVRLQNLDASAPRS